MLMFHDFVPEISGSLTVSKDTMPGTDRFALRVDAQPVGGTLSLRGQPGQIGGVPWDCNQFLIVPIRQNTEHVLWLGMSFWDSADRHADISMGIFPGFEVLVVFPLKNLDMSTLFLPRTPGRLKNVCVGTPVDPTNVTRLALNIPASAGKQTVWIGTPYLSDKEPEYKIPTEPVVDPMGQWTGKKWKSKTGTIDEMIANLKQWDQEPLLPLNAPFDEYGGWKSRQYTASGFFRTEHDGRRWWLIDPAGHPFFSVGPNCVEPASSGPVNGIESLHAWLPAVEGENADAWRHRPGGSTEFSFPIANLIRAFGGSWHERWQNLAGKRMRQWGFNTIANWSEQGLGSRLHLPYVTGMARFPTTKSRIFRDLPDVFSLEYAEDADRCAETLRHLADDPFLIGYFLANEPAWAFGDYNLGEMVLASLEPLATKARLISFLSERYDGDIGRLSAAWKHAFGSFDQLHQPISRAASLSHEADADLRAFSPILIEEYIRVPASAARRVMPNHLSLGLRWAWVASDAFYAGSKHFDIFSINCYQMRPNASEIQKYSQITGLPIMIGEFHAGALDVGLPANALRGVLDQAGRGQFYRWYIEHAAAIPELIGAHYFQWNDQPVLGRFDGECLNIGLVDVCNKPYSEMVDAIKIAHQRLYDLCAGIIDPTTDEPVEAPREGF